MTPDEYRAHVKMADAEAEMFKMLPDISYEGTLQMMVNKAALEGETQVLMADMCEALAKMMAQIDPNAAVGILNLIHSRMHEHHKLFAEFVATGQAVEALDKMAKK